MARFVQGNLLYLNYLARSSEARVEIEKSYVINEEREGSRGRNNGDQGSSTIRGSRTTYFD